MWSRVGRQLRYTSKYVALTLSGLTVLWMAGSVLVWVVSWDDHTYENDVRSGTCFSEQCQTERQAREAERVAAPKTAQGACFTDWDEDGKPYRLCPDVGGGDVSDGYEGLQDQAEDPIWRK